MKRIFITIFISFAFSLVAIAESITYQQYGNTIYGSDGTTYQQYGNTTYGSDGSTMQRYGNTYYYND